MILDALYQRLLRPLLFRIDPETAHEITTGLGRHALSAPGAGRLLRRMCVYSSPRLEQTLAGVKFPNPVGLAAGFDKTGALYEFLALLGFGFIESGTFTALAQDGNPRPRLFRYPEYRALVNRMGFNNPGSERAREILAAARRSVPLGVNIGKSKVTELKDATRDYLLSLDRLYEFADYIAVNVSSPNTPGLRNLQSRAALRELVGPLCERIQNLALRRGETPRPLFLKLAPDLSDDELDEAAAEAPASGAAGLILCNTTIDRSRAPGATESGGLSGAPVRERCLEVIRRVRAQSAPDLILIGVGGISSGADAVAALEAGADLIQVYTGFIYEGPLLPHRLNAAIDAELARRNTTLAELRAARAARK